MNSEGQRHHVSQVRYGQVNHEDDGFRLFAVNGRERVALEDTATRHRPLEMHLRKADSADVV